MNNPYLEVDKKIVSEIYTSNEPMENLEVLCDVFGSRFPGTPGDLGSVKWMVEKLRSYGIENAHYETFEFPGWVRGPARLEVTSPIERGFECISLPHSVGSEIEADLVFLGDGPIEIYEKQRSNVDGNIVMVTSRNPLGMTRLLHRSEKYMRSVLSGAKGWIFMNHYPAFGPPTGSITPIIPSVGVSHEDGSFLVRLLQREGRVKVKITTTDKNIDMTSYNVVCDIPGKGVDEEYVLSGCHYDGHDISQGAVDPASGIVAILEIARVLSMVGDKLKRRVRLVCFGVEEMGLFGSHKYVSQHDGEMDDLRFMLNLDSAGGRGEKGVILHGHPELGPFLEYASKEMGVNIPYFQRVTPYSDHWPFFLRGVPTGSGGDPEFIRRRTGRGYGHTQYDTVDKVKLKNLRAAAANYSRLLIRVANSDVWPVKRKTGEEIKEFIKKQGFDRTIELADKVRSYLSSWEKLHPETNEWLERKSDW